ncbi:hypothetical protein LE190_07860 [Massilia oculi]|uniref:PcRGLX/YetA-like N-terminal RIFT barrel domain-containing protein n=2 Tax=Massilia hydrophila TaxID=3044279 RepID=A0ABS7Y827_9BURK|nr:hypothetical protein [Massilia oculi]
MTSLTRNTFALRVLSTLVCATLAACGGGNESDDMTLAASSSAVAPVLPAPPVSTSQQPAPVQTEPASTVTTQQGAMGSSSSLVSRGLISRETTNIIASDAITDVRLESTNSLTSQTNVPITFGQVFAVGALLPSNSLTGRLDDGSQLPLQVDVKAIHADGSVRHAVISAVVPSLGNGYVRTMSLLKSNAAATVSSVTPANALNNGFTASVQASINGIQYTASADSLLRQGARATWLSGAVANEWHVSAPLVTSSGVAHPHLTARFAIRWYDSIKKARVDVTVENNWAYEAAPQNFIYDAKVTVGGVPVFTKPGMTHYHHARWRKLFWWGGAEPEVNVKHNTAYLIQTKAVPNYDQTIAVAETSLAKAKTGWVGAKTEPMGIGEAASYMPQTGGRDDIGILPGWATRYLLSMDKRAKEVTLGTGTLAGSWSSHFRDKKTDRPISIIDYPYMTLLGNATDTRNPATGQREAFPACAASTLCTNPNKHDSSHQPSLAYLPYLVTGDYYYLEELQFWATYNLLSPNPGYRGYAKGLVYRTQVRAQAWNLRTLAQAAYITPDNDRLKGHFNQIMANNLDWYSNTFLNPATSNQLGVLTSGSALVYSSQLATSPWQDDFFTAALGYTLDLGFTKADALLKWKTKFVVERMAGNGACWIGATMYSFNVRSSTSSPIYSTIAEAYRQSDPVYGSMACGSAGMLTALGLKPGEMLGYANSATGYPANMQPALAYGAQSGGAIGQKAWQIFAARTVKPDYSKAPQFAIIPR